MSIDSMKGFKALNITKGLIKLTFSKHGVTFSKSALSALHNAPYIDMFVNYKEKKLMMRVANKPSAKSVALCRKSNHQDNIRLNHKKLNELITKLTDANTEKHNYAIQGRYIASHDATVFDLDKAVAK